MSGQGTDVVFLAGCLHTVKHLPEWTDLLIQFNYICIPEITNVLRIYPTNAI